MLGLSVGSFLNVVIDRIPHGKSIIRGRSHCDFCQHQLIWYDLIPLFSFILLKRRCRYCHKLLSFQYPLVELLTGLLFVSTYFLPTLLYYLIIISGLIAIFFTDLKYRIIPDQILIILIMTALFFEFFLDRLLIFNHLLSGFALFAIFLGLLLLTRGRGMGFGDVKLAFFMGLFLGFPKVMTAFYLAFLTGAVFSLILIVIGRKTMKFPSGRFSSLLL